MIKECVAGDAGGNPSSIAAGTNSGAVVSPGPKTLTKKKVKRMSEVLTLKQFVESCELEKKAKAKKEKEIKEDAEKITSFGFKAIGGNSIVVEANKTEIKSVEIGGKTSKEKLNEADIKAAYAEFGKDGVLTYIKEATTLVWKGV